MNARLLFTFGTFCSLTCLMTVVIITCLADGFSFAATDCILNQSRRITYEVESLRADHIYIPEKYHSALVAKVVLWAEERDNITFSSDLGDVLDLADELEMDELFANAARCINNIVCREGQVAASVRQLLDSLVTPVALRVLDHMEPDSFEQLRMVIPPYIHQYKRQLEKLLHRSHFALTLHTHFVEQAYQNVVQLRNYISNNMENGACELDVRTRVDKAECSHTHYLFTLEGIVERLTIWNLLQRPFTRVQVYEGIVDAAFGPEEVIYTIEADKHIHIRSIDGQELATVPCCVADTLSASRDFLLAYSTFLLLEPASDLDCNQKMWRWSSVMSAVDMRVAENSTTACLSLDGGFVVHSHRGTVWLSPLDNDEPKHQQVLTKPDDIIYDRLGDVVALAVSYDGSIVAAAYICVAKFWFHVDHLSSQSLDIGCAFGETFGHLAFSPDGSRIALGTWEGSIIQYSLFEGSYLFDSRSNFGKAILHLDWSKDGHFIIVSSHGGVAIIESRQRGFAKQDY